MPFGKLFCQVPFKVVDFMLYRAKPLDYPREIILIIMSSMCCQRKLMHYLLVGDVLPWIPLP